MTNKRGILIVISGPSGSGKGTVIKRLMEKRSDFKYSVSATTRTPRDSDVEGVSYYFVNREEFERRIRADMMLEYAEYCGNYYGTPKKEVVDSLEAGQNVILEIEVKGALQVKKKYPEAVLLMIAPPDYPTLEARLRGRGDNVPESVILERLETAKHEITLAGEYDYVVVNGDNMIDEAADDIIGIVDSEKHRSERNSDFADNFLKSEKCVCGIK